MSNGKHPRILLTGATGFLGRHVARRLSAEGCGILALVRPSSDRRRLSDIVPDAVFLDSSTPDYAELLAGHAPIDAIAHCATCYGRKGETPPELMESNTRFPLKLLEAAAKTGVKLFLDTGTSLPPLLTPYALSKSQFADWGRMYAESGRIRFIHVRLEHMYGPGDDDTKFPVHVARRCLDGAAELPLTEGEQLRDFIYIDDAADAFAQLLLKGADRTAPPFWTEVNVGSGKAITVRAFVENIKRLTGSTTVLNFGAVPYRPGEPMRLEADLSAMRALGWSPSVTLEDGLARMIAALKGSKTGAAW